MMQTMADAPVRMRAAELLAGLRDGGSFGACAYTTACLARLRRDDATFLFARSRHWLLDHQKRDGSWGGTLEFPHDRTVCTLAAVMALADRASPAANCAVQAGLAYLRDHSTGWRTELPGETMGFEMAVPYLLEQAAAKGFDLPYEDWAGLREAREAKLALIPRERLLGEPTSLMYSLETVPPDPALRALERFTGPDGSLANSPSATAALWTATGGPLPAYLNHVSGLDADGGVPSLYPTEAFELAWVLHHLQLAGLLEPDTPGIGKLARLVGPRGRMGLSQTFPLPDPDDSAMALLVLHAAGYDVVERLDGLLAFEGKDCFFTYPGERDGSVTPNARVLEALSLRPGAYPAQRRKIVDFLLASRREGAWWYDKWHVSPYYATAQVTFALTTATDVPMRATGRWLLDTQRPDGSWGGYRDGTPEETGYAVLNLDALARRGFKVPAATWERAGRYLVDHLDGPFPELWVGRSLYTPLAVVRAAVLAGAALAAAPRD
jgi:halimadienyl-diphosphate synthase